MIMSKYKNGQKSFWGKDHLLGGYAGLEHTANAIADLIPECEIYCEPFAGLGRVAKILNHKTMILNDLSEYAYQYLRKNFPHTVVRNLDFEHCINAYDSIGTFFLIDPPWRYKIYKNHNDAVCDRTPMEYYTRLLEILPKIRGNWIICSNIDEHEIKKILTKSGYYKTIVSSLRKVIFGKHARTLLISNRPLTTHQTTLPLIRTGKENTNAS